MVADTPRHETVERVSERLTSVTIDGGSGGTDLVGSGDVTVAGETVTVRVRIPVPPGPVRDRLEREIRVAALEVTGVTTVEVVWEPAVPDPGVRIDALSDVKHVVAVASGKGGVGKSTVATNLAVSLARSGSDVGLLDADVYGPNAPAMLGLSDRTPETTLDDRIRPRTAHGVKAMSMDFLVGEDDPVIWRGVLVDDSLKQLLTDVQWGSLDYLVVDLPPGTGDAHLTLTQSLPLSGAVIVTTPQPVAIEDAKRGLRAFDRYDVPILGIVENMSRFDCPDCGSTHEIFDTGGARRLSERFDVPVLGRLPLNPAVGAPNREEDVNPPGIEVPVIGRLDLPRTREEREREELPDPVVIREDAGPLRNAFDQICTRTAARIDRLATTGGDRLTES
ncbi:Mrp/NBP35 family ATP-binding protein [Halosolutus halophilus]|uniref:Mrp/NBP35 family ATP-binding protein n=1 Tax=Halosolutus halophilus TaxID=1552990 RepID=UPI002234F7F3|nr:Mrp/NBP35 family ATP-binding protein [Halosolutus halophilus]